MHLFLEEIDKVKLTDSRVGNLFEVVDALYENMGQLVINSNLTPEEFQSQFGSEFARRISEMCKVVNLF
jgi:DNA replication protein DnaC